MKVNSSLMGVLMGLVLATAAQAATYNVSAEISNVYGFDWSGPTAPETASWIAGIYQVDFYMTCSDFGAGQRGFGNVVFNIELTGNSLVQNSDRPGWQPNDAQVDINGIVPGGVVPLWATNADFGADVTDLQNILASIATIPIPNVNDPRPNVGKASPAFLGSVYFNWDGEGPAAQLKVVVTQASFASSTGGLLTTDTNAVLNGTTVYIGYLWYPGYMGDTNGDGVVDLTDYTNIQNNFGATGYGVLGDTNNDGVVDVTDFNNVQNYFGFGATASTSLDMVSGVGSVVPEPASLGLLTIGGLMILGRRRRN